MLRNREANRHVDKALKILNEVLSLNAQELLKGLDAGRRARSSMKS